MNDLFDSRTSKEKLLEWLRSRNWTRTHEVDEWGLKNYHIRARRDVQEFVQKGFLRRMTKEELERIFGSSREGAWTQI